MLLGCRAIPLSEPTKSLDKTDVGTFDITLCSPGIPPVDAVFPTPVLVELMGGGFDIPWGTDYILRWPRVQKIHLDRPWTEGVTRAELKVHARRAIEMGTQGEMEGWKDALGVVDRYHAAAATAVPSSSLGEKAREEQVPRRAGERLGVEMLYGLDVEALLRKGIDLATLRTMNTLSPKRKILEPVDSSKKRICLSAKSPTAINLPVQSPPSLQSPQLTKPLIDNIQELLSKARVLAICKSRKDEISALLPQVTHLDIHELTPDKENGLPVCPNNSPDHVVLVRGNAASSVRKALEMVKRASRMGGRWHVYNWKVVQCLGNGMDNLDWGNEHLWTYIDGVAY
jgi:hypothetical protein